MVIFRKIEHPTDIYVLGIDFVDVDDHYFGLTDDYMQLTIGEYNDSKKSTLADLSIIIEG